MATNFKVSKNDLDSYFGKLDERGRGAFGSVNIYDLKEECEKYLSYKRVAVKTINEENATSARKEIAALSRAIDEPYIVTMLGYNEYPFMIIMQCYNDDLSTFAKKRSFAFQEKDILKINKDILFGLKSLEKLGIIHRDMKPRNLLIDYLGTDGSNINHVRTVICDFGCARLVKVDRMQKGELSGLTMDWGTDGFMSPEIISLLGTDNTNGKYSNKTDVWGSGASIFFLGSQGSKPFSIEYLQGLHDDINTNDRRDKEIQSKIKELIDDSFPNVAKILMEMLRWNPQERRNADQTIALVEFLEKDIPVSSEAASTPSISSPETPKLTPIPTSDVKVSEESSIQLKKPVFPDIYFRITKTRLAAIGVSCLFLLAAFTAIGLILHTKSDTITTPLNTSTATTASSPTTTSTPSTISSSTATPKKTTSTSTVLGSSHNQPMPNGPQGPPGAILKYDLLLNSQPGITYPSTHHLGAFVAAAQDRCDNGELQVYTPNAAHQDHNTKEITITAKKHKNGTVTSGKLETYKVWTTTQSSEIKNRGYLEIRALMPVKPNGGNLRGAWPAIWMAGKDIQINIAEFKNGEPKLRMNLQSPNYNFRKRNVQHPPKSSFQLNSDMTKIPGIFGFEWNIKPTDRQIDLTWWITSFDDGSQKWMREKPTTKVLKEIEINDYRVFYDSFNSGGFSLIINLAQGGDILKMHNKEDLFIDGQPQHIIIKSAKVYGF